MSAPTTSRRAARTRPPLSLTSTASGCSTATSASRSPRAIASANRASRAWWSARTGRRRRVVRDHPPGPRGVLARRGLGAAQHVRDRRERHVQRVVQHERDPLGRAQPLQHDHRGHPYRLVAHHGGERAVVVGRGDQRLRQPRPDVALPAHGRRAEPVQADPPDDGGQPRALVAHLGTPGVPAQPGLLHRVLGVGERTRDPVADAEQVGAVFLEGHYGSACAGQSVSTRAMASRSAGVTHSLYRVFTATCRAT